MHIFGGCRDAEPHCTSIQWHLKAELSLDVRYQSCSETIRAFHQLAGYRLSARRTKEASDSALQSWEWLHEIAPEDRCWLFFALHSAHERKVRIRGAQTSYRFLASFPSIPDMISSELIAFLCQCMNSVLDSSNIFWNLPYKSFIYMCTPPILHAHWKCSSLPCT